MSADLKRGASPGGPALSVAKRKRLAALDDVLATRQQSQVPRQQSQAPRQHQPSPAPAPSSRPSSAPPVQTQRPSPHVPRKPTPAPRTSKNFPYNALGDSVLDGSLSAALAQAKVASAAANAAAAAVLSLSQPCNPVSSDPDATSKARGAAASAAASAAADAAAAGADSVAGELMVQLVATNPRASGSDLRTLLAQRLVDRSVPLDNPVAKPPPIDAFSRRSTNYSAGLRSNTAARGAAAAPRHSLLTAPSYKVALRIHKLWCQYTAGLAKAGGGGSGASQPGAAPAPPPDLHGALLRVAQHANPQLVGVRGVVVRRSATCLHLVTLEDRVKVVPLRGCVATYNLNGVVLQLGA